MTATDKIREVFDYIVFYSLPHWGGTNPGYYVAFIRDKYVRPDGGNSIKYVMDKSGTSIAYTTENYYEKDQFHGLYADAIDPLTHLSVLIQDYEQLPISVFKQLTIFSTNALSGGCDD